MRCAVDAWGTGWHRPVAGTFGGWVKVRHLLLAVAALALLTGWARYPQPRNGAPFAEARFTGVGNGGELFTAYRSGICTVPGTTLAMFRPTQRKPVDLRLVPGERIYIRAVFQAMAGSNMTVHGTEYLSRHCNSGASFVPVSGHRYAIDHRVSDTTCGIVIVDADTGVPPDTYSPEKLPAPCDRPLW
jgi:hypothetical protein